MSEEEKKPFHELATKDKERAENQAKELNEKGYFIMEDGKKSSEVVPKSS